MTLLEVVIALALLLITSTALVETAMLSLKSNMNNALRDEAISVGERRMADFKIAKFSDPLLAITSPAGVPDDPATVTRTIRNAPITFTVTKIVTLTSPGYKKVELGVAWNYKNSPKRVWYVVTISD